MGTMLLGRGRLPAQTNEPVRLALISISAESAAAADVLTVELSKQQNIRLLERDEIARAYREQALSAGNADYLKLGRVLGADGLLLLETQQEGTNQWLGTRLVAVKPGVMLTSGRFSWPVRDLADWAAGLANHLHPLLPKLTVLAKDAVPISVVNLRSAVQSAETRELERQLTLLAIERLSREPQVFVLERRRMDLLSAEKELAGMDDSAFWNGSYLLEGTIDRDGYSKERVTLSARLAPPKGGPPVTIEVSGSRASPFQAVDDLVRKVLEPLKLSPMTETWDTQEEARRYFEEARWAYRWRMLPEAQAASEVSCALGFKNKEVAELRIRSYYDQGVDTAAGWSDPNWKLVTFSPGSISRGWGYRPQTDPVFGAGRAPDAAGFARCLRAMELFCHDFQRLIRPDPNPGWEWHDLGLDVLEGASYWLLHYYYLPEARAGQEDAIAAVQALAREMARLIAEQPAYTIDTNRGLFASSRANWGYESTMKTWRDRQNLLDIRLRWGALWAATPEEGTGMYREIIDQGRMPGQRQRFLTPDLLARSPISNPNNPDVRVRWEPMKEPGKLTYLAGWRWEGRRRATAVWHSFIDEICASTNVLTRLEGLYLRCAQAPTDAEHDRSFRELLGFFEKQQDAIAAANLDKALLSDIDALLGPAWRVGFTQTAFAARREAWNESKLRLAEHQTWLMQEARLVERKNYLGGSEYEFRAFYQLFFQGDYRESDARILLPALSGYRSNLMDRAVALDEELAQAREKMKLSPHEYGRDYSQLSIKRVRFRSYEPDTERLEQLLKTKITPPPAEGMRVATNAGQGNSIALRRVPAPAGTAAARSAPVRAGSRPPGFASSSLTNALQVTRFWPLPDRLPQAKERSQLSIAGACFRAGRIWLDVRGSRIGTYANLGEETYFNRGGFFVLDPDSLESEGIPLDPRAFSLRGTSGINQARRSFEVYRDWLYVSSTDQLKRYSLKTRTWEDLPIAIQGHAQITVLNDRMFLATETSLIEIAPDGSESHILASRRRQPAVTLLDTLDEFSGPPLLSGPQQELITYVGGKFYEQERGGDWRLLSALPESARDRRVFVSDGGMILSGLAADGSEWLWAMRNGSHSPELLFVQPPLERPGTTDRVGTSVRRDPLPASRWQLPETVRVVDCPVNIDGSSLWLLAGDFFGRRSLGFGRERRLPDKSAAQAVLFHLHPNKTNAVGVPLSFRLPEGRDLGMRGPPGPMQVVLESTPENLIVSHPLVPGVWVIAKRKLDTYRPTGPMEGQPDAAGLSPNPSPPRASAVRP